MSDSNDRSGGPTKPGTTFTANIPLRFTEDQFELSPFLWHLLREKVVEPSLVARFLLAYTERDGCLVPYEDLWNHLYDLISECPGDEPPPPPPTANEQREARPLDLYERLVEQILWADQDEDALRAIGGRLMGTWDYEFERYEPADPGFNKTTQELIESEFGPEGQALLEYLKTNQYVCPETQYWFGFWALLPVTYDAEGNPWRPLVPSPVDTVANQTAAFMDQLLYAEMHGAIGPVAEYLRDLPAESWVKLSQEGSFLGQSEDEE